MYEREIGKTKSDALGKLISTRRGVSGDQQAEDHQEQAGVAEVGGDVSSTSITMITSAFDARMSDSPTIAFPIQ